MLNDDCFLQIFEYISPVDLASIKDTCKRFSGLATRSFKIFGKKNLSINSSSMIADIWILKHFGTFINSLTLIDCEQYFASWDDIFAIVAKFCNTKLQKICFEMQHEANSTDESLKCLEEIMKNVEVIQFCDFYDDRLLAYCENLKEVHLDGDDLTLNTLWCTKNRNIKRVTLSWITNDDVLEAISNNLLHLEYLKVNCNPISDVNTSKMNCLAQLNHLKELAIGNTKYENIGPLLQNLAKRNVLEYLSLSYFDINESVASAFGGLTQLKELTLNQIDYQIEENVLKILSRKLVNIEKLIFDECESIAFRDITMIIENLLKLKELLISNCDKIDFIERDNYLKLKKPRNLKILLNADAYEKTNELIKGDLSNFVKIAKIPARWDRWNP